MYTSWEVLPLANCYDTALDHSMRESQSAGRPETCRTGSSGHKHRRLPRQRRGTGDGSYRLSHLPNCGTRNSRPHNELKAHRTSSSTLLAYGTQRVPFTCHAKRGKDQKAWRLDRSRPGSVRDPNSLARPACTPLNIMYTPLFMVLLFTSRGQFSSVYIAEVECPRRTQQTMYIECGHPSRHYRLLHQS